MSFANKKLLRDILEIQTKQDRESKELGTLKSRFKESEETKKRPPKNPLLESSIYFFEFQARCETNSKKTTRPGGQNGKTKSNG